MSKEIEFVKFWRIERAKGIKVFYKKYNKYIFYNINSLLHKGDSYNNHLWSWNKYNYRIYKNRYIHNNIPDNNVDIWT